jgi:hypothetical protein
MGRMNAVARLQRGTSAANGEVFDHELYDTIVLATATTSHLLFVTGLGQGATPKTLEYTNFEGSGVMPQGQRLHVKAITAQYLGKKAGATADVDYLYDLIATSTVTVEIQGKQYIYRKPLSRLLGLPIYKQFTPTAAGDNLSISSIGIGRGVDKLLVPITLSALTQFKVYLDIWTAANTALDGDRIRIGLAGIMERLS